MLKSYKNNNDNKLIDDNKILRHDYNLYKMERVMVYPELYIENRPVLGDISQESEITDAICDAFKTEPTACSGFVQSKIYNITKTFH